MPPFRHQIVPRLAPGCSGSEKVLLQSRPFGQKMSAQGRIIAPIWGPKRLQKETRKFQKIIKIPLFVARLSFWHPLAVFGVHFCSPGRPFWPHYAAGHVFCCRIVLGQVYLCLSVVIVTVISAPFKSRCARKCTNLLIFM